LIVRSPWIHRLDYFVRILPISALLLSVGFASLAWLGNASEELLSIGRETVERAEIIRAVKVMVRGRTSPSVVLRSEPGVPTDRAILSEVVGFSFLICAATAVVHCLLSLFVLSHTYLRIEKHTNEHLKKWFSLLYASVDTIYPFRMYPQQPLKTYSLSGDENQNPGTVTAVSFIGSAIASPPLRRRLIVLSVVVAAWIFWPFDDFGLLMSRPFSGFLGYPIFNWAAIFGVSEIAFLLAARALSTQSRQP